MEGAARSAAAKASSASSGRSSFTSVAAAYQAASPPAPSRAATVNSTYASWKRRSRKSCAPASRWSSPAASAPAARHTTARNAAILTEGYLESAGGPAGTLPGPCGLLRAALARACPAAAWSSALALFAALAAAPWATREAASDRAAAAASFARASPCSPATRLASGRLAGSASPRFPARSAARLGKTGGRDGAVASCSRAARTAARASSARAAPAELPASSRTAVHREEKDPTSHLPSKMCASPIPAARPPAARAQRTGGYTCLYQPVQPRLATAAFSKEGRLAEILLRHGPTHLRRHHAHIFDDPVRFPARRRLRRIQHRPAEDLADRRPERPRQRQPGQRHVRRDPRSRRRVRFASRRRRVRRRRRRGWKRRQRVDRAVHGDEDRRPALADRRAVHTGLLAAQRRWRHGGAA